MRVLLALVGFDLRQALRRPSTWIQFLLYAGLGILIAMSSAEFADRSERQVLADAPATLAYLCALLGIFATMSTAAVLGQAAHRDLATGLHPLLFTTPISKPAYLGGRLLAGLLVMAGLLAAIPLGLALGLRLPWIPAGTVGSFRAEAYLWPYLALLLPNLLWSGVLFFALAALTRSLRPVHIGGVVLFIAYLMARNLANSLEHRQIAALLDPFGLTALNTTVQHWTAHESNSRLPPLLGPLLWNRLLWTAVGLAGAAWCLWRLRLDHGDVGRPGRVPPKEVGRPPAQAGLPVCTQRLGAGGGVQQALTEFRLSCRLLLRSASFAIALLLTGVFVWQQASLQHVILDTPTWPTTWRMLDAGEGGLVIAVLLILFAAGELAWRDRERGVAPLTDACPRPLWALLLGQLAALLTLGLAVLACTALVLMTVQLSQGYTDLQPLLYVQGLFGLGGTKLLLIAMLALAVQALVNHKWLGHLVFALSLVATSYLADLGLEHPLWQLFNTPGVPYSDLNGFGAFLAPWAWWQLHWTLLTGLLLALGGLVLVRGSEGSWRWRWRLARRRWTGPVRAVVLATVAAGLVSTGWLWWNINIVGEYRTKAEGRALVATYEREFAAYAQRPHPRLSALEVRCDLFPERGRAVIAGDHHLVNRTPEAIGEFLVLADKDAGLEFDPPARLVRSDAELGCRIYALEPPLPPGGALRCRSRLELVRRGLDPLPALAANGTFLHSVLPTFGYDRRNELDDKEHRREAGLPERQTLPPPDNAAGRQNSYISHDADWIDLTITVTTDPGQTGLAPGALERAWEEDGRACFRYRSRQPALNFWCALSGRYARDAATWNGVELEILHHPTHTRNLATMRQAMQDTLDYAGTAFGPYRLDHLRIAEFPRYGTFAQSFPGLIPFSEGIGFIARLDAGKRIDYPFYVTAHEVAHQWWAHQVVGADVQGRTLLSESLAQYTALRAVARRLGEDHARRILRHELDNYLLNRKWDKRGELPLALVEPRHDYVAYKKGAVALWALGELMGFDRLDAALRTFIEAWRFRGPPYPGSPELIAAIRAEAPPDLQETVADFLERIVLWEFRLTAATATAQPDGTWRVELAWEAKRLLAQADGREVEAPLDAPVDLVIFATAEPGQQHEEGRILARERRRLSGSTGSATFVVPDKPAHAGIDPFRLYIDRTPEDNLRPVQTAAP